MDNKTNMRSLRDILSEKQVNYIVNKTSASGSQLLKYEVKPAVAEGVSGFLGEHFKVTLVIKEEDLVKRQYLFVKIVPRENIPKAEFINDANFFGTESLTFEIFEGLPDEEYPTPWGVKALIHNDNILVLPDLSVEGYTTHPAKEYFDLDHVKVTLKSLAHYHAAIAKHLMYNNSSETSNSYKLPENYACFINKQQFDDCPLLRATIKLTMNCLKEFSSNMKHYPLDLEDSLSTWYINACNGLREYEDTLNVIIHKDLWANNIMFKYSGGKPVNAVLVDFQCARYAPPAIDVMVSLYCTTSKEFRKHYEHEVLDYYYSVFSEAIDEPTKLRLTMLNYHRETYLNLCKKLRPVGMMVPIGIFPFILMASQAAQEAFDNPQTFHDNFLFDRCAPVIAYARNNEYYKIRLLEIFEEFVEWHLAEFVK